MEYNDFLKGKESSINASGFECDDLNPMLYPFQADITRWSLKLGKSAIFAACGLG